MAKYVSPLAAARHLCELSDWVLTNLELQKILYLAHMRYLGETGEPLIAGTFEAWDYGPVLPPVYEAVKVYGGNVIGNVFGGVGKIGDPDIVRALDTTYDQLKSFTAGQLVEETHWRNGAWAAVYKPGRRGIPIPNNLIKWEYDNRVLTRSGKSATPRPI